MGITVIKNTIRTLGRHGIAHVKELMGAKQQYCIRGGYTHRTKYCYFDDTAFEDEYQKEVYMHASHIADREMLGTVYDIGCGSGFKLVKYLGRYDTLGFDVPETVSFLNAKYPGRQWRSAAFSERGYAPADLVICSDVIEHVLDPDELMTFILSVTRKWVIISTPDRNREYSMLSPFHLGPPHTDVHIREWAFKEFNRYVGQYLEVREHFHSNPEHATQMIVANIRN